MSIKADGNIERTVQEINLYNALVEFVGLDIQWVYLMVDGRFSVSVGSSFDSAYNVFGNNASDLIPAINALNGRIGVCPECGSGTLDGTCQSHCHIPQSDLVSDDTVIVDAAQIPHDYAA